MNSIHPFLRQGAPIIALLAALILASPVLAAKPAGAGSDGSNGANQGTLKIVDAATAEAAAEQDNEPRVCAFYLEFSGAAVGATGSWVIVGWPPTGDGDEVASGTYTIGVGGTDTTDVLVLDPGHYRVEWQGASDGNAKHKTLWVDDCTPAVEATTESSVEPTSEPSVELSVEPTSEPAVEPTPSGPEPEGGQAPSTSSPAPSTPASDPAPVDSGADPEDGLAAVVNEPIVDVLPDTAMEMPILPGLGAAIGLVLVAAGLAGWRAHRAGAARQS